VTKEDQEPRGWRIKDFVLTPFKKNAHGLASRKALCAYAKAIEATDPELAGSLRSWAIFSQVDVNERTR